MMMVFLKQAIMEKKGSQTLPIRNKLVDIYRLKQEYPNDSLKRLDFILTAKLNEILQVQSKKSSIRAIQERLKIQKEGLVRALLHTPDGTNNLTERELRSTVINKKISYGSDSFSGMETTAILGSGSQTLSKTDEPLIPRLNLFTSALFFLKDFFDYF